MAVTGYTSTTLVQIFDSDLSTVNLSLVNGPQMEIFVGLQRAECEIHSQILKNSAR